MFISSLSGGLKENLFGVRGLIMGGILIFLLFFVGYVVLPRITKKIACINP